MPEEEKAELKRNGKIMKEIYFDSAVVDKFWIEESRAYHGKPENRMLGTLLFNGCCDETGAILFIGSDCRTEDMNMEGEVFSEGSDGSSFDYERITRSVVLRKIINGGDLDDAKVLGGEDHEEEENKFYEGEHKEAEGTNTMEAAPTGESKSQEDNKLHNLETEMSVISLGEREVQGSINSHQQFPGSLPYSGSVSLRSTSSTASAQSFAFPILAEEYNTSPVRMAKADRRQLRKKKGWIWRMKIGWFCCRF